jgi:hypothetical protein
MMLDWGFTTVFSTAHTNVPPRVHLGFGRSNAGGYTFGDNSERVVVTERFVIRIPPGADLAATAPLLCAGVTTFHQCSTGTLPLGKFRRPSLQGAPEVTHDFFQPKK